MKRIVTTFLATLSTVVIIAGILLIFTGTVPRNYIWWVVLLTMIVSIALKWCTYSLEPEEAAAIDRLMAEEEGTNIDPPTGTCGRRA